MFTKIKLLLALSLLVAGAYAQDKPAEPSAADVAKSALNVGAKMPAFTLNDATNKPVKSADLLKQGNLVVVFYRGAW